MDNFSDNNAMFVEQYEKAPMFSNAVFDLSLVNFPKRPFY